MAKKGWITVYLLILLLASAGYYLRMGPVVYTAAGLWLVFVLWPAFLSGAYHKRIVQHRYAAASRLARLMSLLHPADGWREQPAIARALQAAQSGDFITARKGLEQIQGRSADGALTAVVHLHRISGQWEELLHWLQERGQTNGEEPQLLPVLLRAHGETGNLSALVELYERKRGEISRLAPPASREFCRLMLFAFFGETGEVQRLFQNDLRHLPPAMQQFWIATAELAAGLSDSARDRLEQLLPKADAPMKLAIERRLAQIGTRSSQRDPAAERVLEEALLEQRHEETFGTARPLFSRKALCTQILIAMNIVAFVAEMALGGATNPATLYQMGAMDPSVVRGGEWWRLVSATFLHFGPVHLGMNMLGLWLLGPFTEFALGFVRFLVLYLCAGVGSMAVVMLFSSSPYGIQITVGASGSILGLVGATGALMLRGWLRDRAHAAKRRFLTMIFIVAMQTVFDSMVPQVSMVAHLSGALLGFTIALLLPDRLRSPGANPAPPAAKPV